MSHDPAEFQLASETATAPEKGQVGVVGSGDLFASFAMTPYEYLKIETEQNAIIASAHRTIHAARNAVDPMPPLNQLRRAEATDIRPGLIVWHDNGDGGWFWHIVTELRLHGDDFKAYVADDGCRYGLRGAWVYANT